MDISKTKRDPDKVNTTLIVNDNDEMITKSGCHILIPLGYVNKALAIIDSEVSTLGIYAIFIDEVTYAVSLATSMVNLGPCETTTVLVKDESYYRFDFEPGSVVIKNVMLVKNKQIVNNILDYFVDYGHSPWFFNQLDMAELLSGTPYFNDLFLASSQSVFDALVAAISRDKKDIKKYARHTMKTASELYDRPKFIPQRDIGLGATSNLARLNGSEQAKGIKAALLSEDKPPEPLEELFIR